MAYSVYRFYKWLFHSATKYYLHGSNVCYYTSVLT